MAAAATNRRGHVRRRRPCRRAGAARCAPTRAGPTARAARPAGSSSRACSTRTRAAQLVGQLAGRGWRAASTRPREVRRIACRATWFAAVARVLRVGADAGDHQRRPRAVPPSQPGVQRVVLTPLPGQQPVGEPIAVGRAHQVARADHPGQRHPQRRLPDVEIGCEPDQFARRRPRGVRAEQHAQHHRPRGQPAERALAIRLHPRGLAARVAERLVALPSPRRGSRARSPPRRTRAPRACAARRRRTRC